MTPSHDSTGETPTTVNPVGPVGPAGPGAAPAPDAGPLLALRAVSHAYARTPRCGRCR